MLIRVSLKQVTPTRHNRELNTHITSLAKISVNDGNDILDSSVKIQPQSVVPDSPAPRKTSRPLLSANSSICPVDRRKEFPQEIVSGPVLGIHREDELVSQYRPLDLMRLYDAPVRDRIDRQRHEQYGKCHPSGPPLIH